jgi:hypothetical protein
MEFTNNYKKIKKALLKGGLVVADRGTGKTRALSEILNEDPLSIVVVEQESQRTHLKLYLRSLGFNESEINSRIFYAANAESALREQRAEIFT